MSIEVTNKKTESASSERHEIPSGMEVKSVKQESDCLVQSEIHIKTEPQEDANGFPVIAGTSYEMCPNYNQIKFETDEPLIKIECKDPLDESMEDSLNITSEIKVKEYFPMDLDQGKPRIKTKPTEEENEEILLETDKNNSYGCISNQDQNQLLIENESDRSREKKYFCYECHKTFIGKWHLDNHLRIHTDEKPFTCGICKKSFNTKSNLKTHMLIHSGEKTHICDVCEKLFSRKSNLNSHKLIHNGEKPFSCDECDKSFTQKVNLVIHKRIHTCDKPYTCDLCKKIFTVKSNLITHKRLHTGEKPFSCDVCTKLFADKSTLNRHKKIHSN